MAPGHGGRAGSPRWHRIRPHSLAMRRRPGILAALCLLVPLGAAGGCAAAPSVQPRSTVFAPASLRAQIRRMEARRGEALPWYASRNDARLTTFSGFQTAKVEHTETFVYERRRQHDNRVRDDVHISTYRSSNRQLVR